MAPKSNSSKTNTSPKKMTDTRKHIEEGFHLDRNIFFEVWFEAALKNNNLTWMTQRLNKRCANYADNASPTSDGREKSCKEETVRSKMNYYKKKELEQRDKGKLVELPPVISNNFKTLEQLSQEYQQLKDKKR